MLQTLRNAWKVTEIRHKLLFVGLILLLYRIGAVMPVPFVDSAYMNTYFESLGSGSIFNYLNVLSGSSFSQATLFALSVSPYITASIVLQLLDVAFPSLFGGKDGDPEVKKKRMTVGTRITTIILAVLTSFGYYMIMRNQTENGTPILADAGMEVLGAIVIIVCYCAGAALIMWMAEKIDEKGIGNGVSLILLANILSSMGATVNSFISMIQNGFYDETAKDYSNVGGGILSIALAVLSVLITLAIIMFVIWVTGSERRIKIKYAKRVVGRKMYGGQSQDLPLKVNMAGVMPIIFASSIVSLPATILGFIYGSSELTEGSFPWVLQQMFSITDSPLSLVYMVLTFLLIIGFSYFYITISFDPVEVANRLQKDGGSILGTRPGTPTAEKIKRILSKVTLMGAFFLAFVAIFPMLVTWIVEMCNGTFANIAFGGTSLLIVIGVIQEMARAIEAEVSMRAHGQKGFLD